MRELDLPPIADGFGFEEEHDLARQAARRFLSDRCPLTVIRKLADTKSAPDPALHRAIAELGWLELALGDPLHLGLLFEEMGRVLWPSPFFASTLALRLMAQAGGSPELERWRSAIVSGDKIATIALPESGPCVAEPVSGGFVLRGELRHVLAGADAELALVACQVPGDGLGIFVLELPSPNVTSGREISVDVTRPSARLRLDRVRLPRQARLGADAAAAIESVRIAAATLLACEMVGSAEAVLEKTRLYAIERQQFGRAIGSFQAVKHPIVDVMIGVELGRSLALGAASLLAGPSDAAALASHMAKAAAGELYSNAVKKGVQLHGGFGFTWDCDVHFYFKRALWARSSFGDSAQHRRQLGEALLGASSA